ncbi:MULTISPECIES: hypothetical protein [Halorubrum]|uniref:Uncharacterized protein n=1 Tax=Halorubrum sodomense TaxID=35743 RepID=A0A1I6FM32_HALSD|nr:MULTISPECIES: hypothetical protein [Halorubrum]TKX53351.1 hypothetical protein EXE42_13310 [Halorubrum sp. SP3]TKX68303.1 hypothetical protein EXE45_11980 [Halorubrum sp. SP9]SFR30948.1 hypothetical protein SAMN04487937_0784 [Halorubrum sodomense]
MTADRDERDSGDGERPGRRTRRASRRGVLAVGAAGLLAGCLVTSESEGGPGPRQTDGNGSDTGSDGSDGGGQGSGDDDGSGAGGDAGGDGGAGSDGDSGGSGDESTPETVAPDGSGLVVTDATVLDVSEGGGQTTVRARLTVENAGRFEYGVVEFRVDAYATPAGTDEREPVGFEYDTERFTGENRFDGSRPRQFTVEIVFSDDRTSVRPDPDWYAVDAAVRRAEPI